MADNFDGEIGEALGLGTTPALQVAESDPGELASCFRVSELAVASMRAAARQLAAFTGTSEVAINRRRTLLWFGMTLRPIGWSLPSAWDPIAGDYRAADGWIRLHTNAPHHRDAALAVIGCAPEKAAVSQAVGSWQINQLEEAVVAAGGAAAAMHDIDAWARHPQGIAVAAEPLIAWRETGHRRGPATLKDIKVLDLTRVLAGPVATRFLAGFGAKVLRIDPPSWNEPGVEPEVTLGKRRAGLDLHRAEDRQTFEALLAGADVLVHGYRPGALERLGYGEAERQALSHGLIDVSLNAYGWTGPWTSRRGFDSLVQMSTGIASEGMRRAAAERPVPLPVQALDHATGYLMAAAVLNALRRRRETGICHSARLSLARTAALLLSGGASEFQGSGVKETDADRSPHIEPTPWGPAHRLEFPVSLDGQPPTWRHPAGPLRSDAASW
ncbi:CoA transferase [Pleomorphomonas sp. PLEO]|uniref:CoA transferase n=1 Tax=Pleomorphomonas sp. PLEO TaxID=3239306 RepID=UPI00351EA110